MAFFARNLAVFKKLTLSSCNYTNLYRKICTPNKLRYNYIHNVVAPVSNDTFYEKNISVVSGQNNRNKFSDAKEGKTSKKVAAYGRVQQAFGELSKELDLKDTDSKFGKMVKYILSKNVRINDFNMTYPQHTAHTYICTIKKKYGLQYGRFTPNEDEVIKNKWNGLCGDCGIKNPMDLSRELLMNVNSEDPLERKKLNVIGCYLDPDLKKARHATEVVHRAIYISNYFVSGKFKPEEDKIILQEVQRNGNNIEVYKDLCLKLNRNPMRWVALRRRYETLIQRKDFNSGKWTIDEDKFMIETLFMNKEPGIDALHSIKYSDYKNIQQIKRRPKGAQDRYERYIKPILLKYHYGKLGCNSKYDFMRYVVENKITSVKEIQWKKVLQLFPCETRSSLNHVVDPIFRCHKKSPLDHLYLVLQEYLNNYDEKHLTEDQIEYQSNIVGIYLNCKK